MKFHPSALSKRGGSAEIGILDSDLFQHGAQAFQFNVVSKETLLDAQQHPESHQDLVVRVAGYSAYFVVFGTGVQDEIIALLKHNYSR